MYRTAQIFATVLLMAATGLHAGCGSGASGLTTASTGDGPAGVSNEDPMARPVQVAWTSARAKRCGFNFDPAKLRSNYLAYESRQGTAGEQLGKIEKSFDTTFKVIGDRVSANPDFCTEKASAEIKADLQRHLAGDFAPNLPKQKVVPTCGFFGCNAGSSSSDDKWDSQKWWKDQEMKRGR